MGEAERMRVLIVDDHPMVREIVALGCAERPSLEVVGQARDGIEALEQCALLRPDVVVLDLSLPGMGGFDVLLRLREHFPSVRVLILSARDDQAAVFESVRLGAHGYLGKTGSVAEIAAAVEAVARNTRVFDVGHQRSLHAELGERVRHAREAARLVARLTRREREVLGLLADGLGTRAVADQLAISARTVEAHVRSLCRKLGVRSRVQAVRRAAEMRLVNILDSPPGDPPEVALDPRH